MFWFSKSVARIIYNWIMTYISNKYSKKIKINIINQTLINTPIIIKNKYIVNDSIVHSVVKILQKSLMLLYI